MTKLLVLSDDPQVLEAVNQLTWCEIIRQSDPQPELTEAWSTIVLLDMAYPGITDVIQQCIHQKCRIILIAEPHQQTELVELMNHGADDYLLKPVHPALLEKCVRRLVDKIYIAEVMSVAAHDLKNPIASITGWISLTIDTLEEIAADPVDKDTLTALIPDWLKIVQASALRLDYMINDLRDGARLDAGQKLSLDTEVVDIVPLFKSVVESDKNRLRDRELTLTLNLPDSLPCVSGDASFLKRLFWNLLSNAIKYSEADNTITVSAQVDGQFMHIFMRDEGIGMTDIDIERVFGRGLDRSAGIRVARAIVHEHGGDIWAEKNLDKGITVHFTLPIAKSPDSESSV